MKNSNKDKPALLIIDMVKDTFYREKKIPIAVLAEKIIEPINNLSARFREKGWPVIFSTDAFHEDDFMFTSSMHPHSLAGTEGAEVIDELVRESSDIWLPKPRYSAFFKTGLENTLREMNVTMCAVGGIATNFCVLTTALDALQHDFKAVFIEDCSAAAKQEIHEHTLGLYRRNPLYPLLQVLNSGELLEALE